MDPKKAFGACCQHMLLKTTFVAISKKGSKNGIFLPQWVRFCHLAENDFWTKILLKTGLLASKLCNSPFFMTQSAFPAILWIFENWKFSKNLKKKSKIVKTKKKLSSENASKNKHKIWSDWTQILMFHNFCSTGAILMRSKYVIDHILKFLSPHRHPQYVHPKAQNLKFLNFFPKKNFSSIFKKQKWQKCAKTARAWSHRSGILKYYF